MRCAPHTSSGTSATASGHPAENPCPRSCREAEERRPSFPHSLPNTTGRASDAPRTPPCIPSRRKIASGSSRSALREHPTSSPISECGCSRPASLPGRRASPTGTCWSARRTERRSPRRRRCTASATASARPSRRHWRRRTIPRRSILFLNLICRCWPSRRHNLELQNGQRTA